MFETENTGIFNPEALIEEFMSLDAGKPRLMGIKRAIEEADRAKSEDYSFIFRYEYIEESTFNCDHFDALLLLPELLALFDAMEERGHKFAWQVLCAYEWILQDSIYFYQVSLDAHDKFFEDYLKRAAHFGKPLRMYLLLVMERLRFVGNSDRGEKISEVLKLFRGATQRGMTLYEMHECIKFELYAGNTETAKRYSEIVFREGELEPQGEIPGKTYGYYAEYHIQRGEYEEAALYADKMLPYMTSGNILFFDEYFVLAIEIFRVTDYLRAYELWKKYNEYYTDCKNPALKFFFGAASYRLLRSSGDESEIKLSKSYYNSAKEIAEKFDKRHGNSFFISYLDK